MISIGERGFRRRCSSIRMCFLRVWVLSIWTRLRDHRSLSIIHIDEFSNFFDSSRHLAVKVGDLGRLLRATILWWFCKPSVNDCIFRSFNNFTLACRQRDEKNGGGNNKNNEKKRKKHGKGRNAEGKGVLIEDNQMPVGWLIAPTRVPNKKKYLLYLHARAAAREREINRNKRWVYKRLTHHRLDFDDRWLHKRCNKLALGTSV